MNKKKVVFYVGISSVSIKYTEHYMAASLTRERYFQHEKIKFVSPRSHVISSMSLWKLPHFLHDLKHILKQPMVHSNWQGELILKI